MDPLNRYATSLKKSKSFFEGKKKTPKGTPITQSQLLKLYQNRADCPVCGTEFSGTNNNTEHIHPRALGGTNEATNKIQMCKLCNHCRNSVMQHHLIGPPYSKSYPLMWDAIQRFIMWSEITIDDGLEAGEVFPEIHQSFMDERFAGLTPPKGPSRAFDRASTIDGAGAPNYPHNRVRGTSPRSRQPPMRSSTKRGFWERFATPILDFMTGYGKENISTQSSTSEKPTQPIATLSASESTEIDSLSSVRSQERIEVEGGFRIRRDLVGLRLEEVVSVVLSSKLLPLSVLAVWLSKDLKHQNLISDNDHYLTHFGFSKNMGLRRVLVRDFSHIFQIHEEEGVWFIQPQMLSFLTEWELFIRNASKNQHHFTVDECLKHAQEISKRSPFSWDELLTLFCVSSKHSESVVVLAFLDRTTLEYRMVETNGIQTIHIISNEVLEPITALDSEEFPPLAIGFKTHILDAIGPTRDEFRLTSISQKLSKHLSSIGREPMSLKQFAKHHGIHSSLTAVDILDEYFSEELTYRRHGATMVFVRRVGSEEE